MPRCASNILIFRAMASLPSGLEKAVRRARRSSTGAAKVSAPPPAAESLTPAQVWASSGKGRAAERPSGGVGFTFKFVAVLVILLGLGLVFLPSSQPVVYHMLKPWFVLPQARYRFSVPLVVQDVPQVFSSDEVEKLTSLVKSYTGFVTYTSETSSSDFKGVPAIKEANISAGEPAVCGAGLQADQSGQFCFLPNKFEAAFHFARWGGRSRRMLTASGMEVSANYFRATFAWDGKPSDDAVGKQIANMFLHHPTLIQEAKNVFKLGPNTVVRPSVVYANIMIEGQELPVHTDVPVFRGLDRKNTPQWLLTFMHHSGLFEDYRVRIATAVSWWADPSARGGQFAYFPDGPTAAAKVNPGRRNTAAVLDTDTVFHNVDLVTGAQDSANPPRVMAGRRVQLRNNEAVGNEAKWNLVDVNTDEVLSSYSWSQMRTSISWKAFVFASKDEEQKYLRHTDDLTLQAVLDTFQKDLVARGVFSQSALSGVFDDYLRWPLVLDEVYMAHPHPTNSVPSLGNLCVVFPEPNLLCWH